MDEVTTAPQPEHPQRLTITDAPGPWLTDRQQHVWRSFLMMTRMVDEQIERDMQRSGDMPFAYYLILAMLSEAPDRRLRMNKLSEVVGFSQSRLSHAVTRLEDLGWVRREQSSADKRGQYASLTPAGLTTLQRVAPSHAETVRSTVFDPLSPQQLDALEDVVRTLIGSVRPEERDRHARNIHPDLIG